MNDLTVCITSFRRSGYLFRAIASCEKAGIRNVFVFAMQPDDALLNGFATVNCNWLPVDLGCHELWLQAAYRSTTERLIILHDDDMLAPEFGEVYASQIRPVLDRREAGFASWRGHCRKDDGAVRPVEYFVGQSGVYQSKVLREVIMRRGRLSLSPIISIFNRAVLIHALKESADSLPWLRPGMQLGTEIVAYLRHCDAFGHWLHVHKVLSYYGEHDGSGTIKVEKTGNLKTLTEGYDEARKGFSGALPRTYPPRLLLTYWPGLVNERVKNARRTWDFHFNLGDMLDFPYPSQTTPKLHDIMNAMCEFAMPEDVIVYANLDLAFTIDLPERILAYIRKTRGVCVGWRRSMSFNPEQNFKSVRQGVKDGGVDLIAMSPAWWKAHRNSIPEMHISANYWDFVFRVFCERITNNNCYLDDGTYHEPHEAFFKRIKLTTPEQKFNFEQAKRFFTEIGHHQTVKYLEQEAASV